MWVARACQHSLTAHFCGLFWYSFLTRVPTMITLTPLAFQLVQVSYALQTQNRRSLLPKNISKYDQKKHRKTTKGFAAAKHLCQKISICRLTEELKGQGWCQADFRVACTGLSLGSVSFVCPLSGALHFWRCHVWMFIS